MRQRSRICLGALVMLVACGALPAQETRANHMPGMDFSKFHTYKWITIEGGEPPSQIIDAQIKQAVDSQLAAKGLTKTDAAAADLYIGYQVAVDQERQWNAYGGRGWRFGGMETATSSTMDIGTLVLDMYDQAGKQLVWSGKATKTIATGKNQEKTRRNWTRPWRSC